jgi:hypothetical protein
MVRGSNPGVGEIFRNTGIGAHPASYTMGTGFSPEVKRPGRGIDHPPLGLRGLLYGELYLYLYVSVYSAGTVAG